MACTVLFMPPGAKLQPPSKKQLRDIARHIKG
jgi:hypothetical protein